MRLAALARMLGLLRAMDLLEAFLRWVEESLRTGVVAKLWG